MEGQQKPPEAPVVPITSEVARARSEVEERERTEYDTAFRRIVKQQTFSSPAIDALNVEESKKRREGASEAELDDLAKRRYRERVKATRDALERAKEENPEARALLLERAMVLEKIVGLLGEKEFRRLQRLIVKEGTQVFERVKRTISAGSISMSGPMITGGAIGNLSLESGNMNVPREAWGLFFWEQTLAARIDELYKRQGGR